MRDYIIYWGGFRVLPWIWILPYMISSPDWQIYSQWTGLTPYCSKSVQAHMLICLLCFYCGVDKSTREEQSILEGLGSPLLVAICCSVRVYFGIQLRYIEETKVRRPSHWNLTNPMIIWHSQFKSLLHIIHVHMWSFELVVHFFYTWMQERQAIFCSIVPKTGLHTMSTMNTFGSGTISTIEKKNQWLKVTILQLLWSIKIP